MSLYSNENVAKYVKRMIEIQGEASLQVAKEGMFQPPEEVVSKYQEIFRKRGMQVIVDCFEAIDDPKKFFILLIRNKSK